jgi:hypothetical protein
LSSNQNKPRYGYIDATDWDHELGEAMGGTKIYCSKEDILRERSCVKECGIIKVKISFVKRVTKGKKHRG